MKLMNAHGVAFSASCAAGRPTERPASVTLTDGTAVKLPGTLTVPIICGCVDEIVQVEEEDVSLKLETRGYEHIQEIVSYLKGQGYSLTVM